MININVKDDATKKNIEWASLSINKYFFLSTNEEGLISLNPNQIAKTDSIVISALGYKPKTLSFNELQVNNVIVYLLPDVQVLNEVVVNPNKTDPKRVVLGNVYKFFSIVAYITRFDTKYAQYIPNRDGLDCQIRELEFTLSNDQKGIDQPFRVNVYTRDKNSKLPYKELIEDVLIVRNFERKQKFVVDISKYNITTPEDGFFIVAETLNKEYYSNRKVNVYKSSVNRLPSFKVKFTKEPLGDYYNLNNINSSRWYKNNSLGHSNFYFTAILSCQ